MHMAGRPLTFVLKGADSISQHDFFVTFFDDIKIALYPLFQVNQHVADLLSVQVGQMQRLFVLLVNLFADFLTDDADKTPMPPLRQRLPVRFPLIRGLMFLKTSRV